MMKCPSCQQSLQTIDYEGIAIDLCDGCGGHWLDSGELRHIVKAREVRFDPESRRAAVAATKVPGIALEDVDQTSICPKCDVEMTPVNYGGDSGIIIDRCDTCRGVWLQQGELEKTQMVVESWEDNLPDDLARHRAALRKIEVETGAQGAATPSRFGFVNAAINGIVDAFG